MGDDELEFLLGENPDDDRLDQIADYLMAQITRYSIMMQKVMELKALARGLSDDGAEEDPDARC